ncbi:hypothetical protein [Micromonospora sp. ALFpr18c]|uniref:hypothetical protein n=1 Tax=unclassified Micromonospora TaxID=2617518 RepID=UPI001CEDF754|nr:hypothetical protein [Micromonospora sp. ALFpr18c]
MVGAVVRIACDESGFSGTNLLHSTAPVITHASVDLVVDEAVALITALRSGFRFSPQEMKSGQFLRRPGADEAVQWFLASLAGRAHVHLIDKEFFLVTRIVDFLLAEPSYAAGTRLTRDHRPAALALYEAGRSAGSDWDAFLAAFVDLVRMKRRLPVQRTPQRFFQARDALRRHPLGAAAGTVLDGLDPSRVGAVVARLDTDDRSVPPPLEPLLPALAETVLTWSAGRRQVLVTHDEQSALTADRLTRLQRTLAGGGASAVDAERDGALATGPQLPDGVSPLAGLVMVDSRDDPRVQVADLLAGVARRLPEVVDAAIDVSDGRNADGPHRTPIRSRRP